MWEKFGDSEWNIPQARSTVAQLRHHAGNGREYDGIELFLALCEYLDRLHGKHGFDYFFTGAEQAALAAAVQEARGPEIEPDPESERLLQPVNAAVTLAEGRDLVNWLDGQPDWQRQIGLCLRAMYAYLDHLYGGPGAFNQLLKPAELERVAAR